MLSPQAIRIVLQITTPVAANADTITRRVHERMLEARPEVNVSLVELASILAASNLFPHHR